MITRDKCPVCDSASSNRVFDSTDHTVTLEKFGIWQCAHCSLRFTQNIPDVAEIGKYYRSENYISHSETRRGIINWLYLRVRKYTLAAKRRLVEEETGVKGGSLLDIGAGAGAFVHHMIHNGWRAEGLEPDENAIARASAEYGLQLKPSAHLFQFSEPVFNAVTMWHVLEHVHELHEYINQVAKILNPSGRFFVAVPNYTSYDADRYGAAWAAYDVPRHLYHFSPASMHELVKRHRCIIEKMHPMWFDSFYVSMLSEKYKTGRSNILKGFWTGLRSNIKAISNKRRASSIIYVIRPADHLPA